MVCRKNNPIEALGRTSNKKNALSYAQIHPLQMDKCLSICCQNNFSRKMLVFHLEVKKLTLLTKNHFNHEKFAPFITRPIIDTLSYNEKLN